jgi:predicted ArsR family transcriptional regulator
MAGTILRARPARSPEGILHHTPSCFGRAAPKCSRRGGASAPHAVRQSLERLWRQSLVQFQDEVAGRGRPRRVWLLTAAAARHFSGTQGQLTVDPPRDVRPNLVPVASSGCWQRADADRPVSRAIGSCTRPRQRLIRLGDICSEKGDIARVSTTHDGSFPCVEHHCPICAATSCRGF